MFYGANVIEPSDREREGDRKTERRRLNDTTACGRLLVGVVAIAGKQSSKTVERVHSNPVDGRTKVRGILRSLVMAHMKPKRFISET